MVPHPGLSGRARTSAVGSIGGKKMALGLRLDQVMYPIASTLRLPLRAMALNGGK
jgi:hypothetical protein